MSAIGTPPHRILAARPGAPSRLPLAAAVASALYIAAFVVLLPTSGYSAVGSLAVTPLVVLAGLALAWELSRRVDDPRVAHVIRIGYVLKLLSSAAFFWLVFGGPGGDAGSYHTAGAEIAGAVWHGDVSALVSRGFTGTAAMEQLAGALYSVTSPAAATGFVAFATASFVGSYLFYRAFCLAVPNGDRRLYATLVFLLPSVLFWPSSLGKEAWMMLTLGLTSYGAARLLSGRRGVLPLVAGIAGAGLIRPHMAVLALAALFAAPLAQAHQTGSPGQRRGRLVLWGVVVATGVAATVATRQAFGLSGVSPDALTGLFEQISENTARGGSEFTNVQTINPLLFPLAFTNVVLRPFPHEATNLIMLLAAGESLVVAALLIYRRRSLAWATRAVMRDGYMAFAAAYTLWFCLSYSYFNNLGLLARERVQLLPILFILVAAGPGRRSPAP